MGIFDKLKGAAYQAAASVHQAQHGDGSTEENFERPAGDEGGQILDDLSKEDPYGLRKEK
jgi:hypothetical protein